MQPCLDAARDADDFGVLWERASEGFELPYELDDFPDAAESAYALDFGTAAAMLALNAAGCPTIMACSHQTGYPYIAFWLPVTKLSLLEEAAKEARIGLGNAIEGAVEVYSDAPDRLLRFAVEMRSRSAAFRRIQSAKAVRRPEAEGADQVQQLAFPLDRNALAEAAGDRLRLRDRS